MIELAAAAGLVLDPWQRYALRGGLGENADGSWAARRVGVWVPRQNGKGGVIEALELSWLFLFGERLILHSAHEYKTAAEAFLRIRELIEGTPDFDRRIHRVWQANGEQGVELTRKAGGGRLRFVARSRSSGRGFTGDKNVLDEAQELTESQMAALLPTLSARPNPQLWLLGTPPTDPAAWIYGMRAAGEAGEPGIAWMDWGVDLDPTNPEHQARASERDLWYRANPALGIRIAESWVAETELGQGGLGDSFLAERLGAWLPRAIDGHLVIPQELWQSLVIAPERPTDLALAIDVSHDRSRTAIVAVGPREGGGWVASVVDYRPGTRWVAARAAELRERWNPVAIALDTKRAAGSLLVELEEHGITVPDDPDRPHRGDLICPTAAEVGQAYGMTVDEIRDRQGIHHLDEAPLNVAIAGATTRSLSGGTAWDHKGATDISPLVGLTNAFWAYQIREPLVRDVYDPLANIF